MWLFDDLLATLGVILGAILVLIGLATVAGKPWLFAGPLAAAGQLFGAILAIVIGAALVWLTARDQLPL